MGEWPVWSTSLRDRTATAVADPVLRSNIGAATDRFGTKRTSALAAVHDPDGLRRAARGVRGQILSNWAETLETLADNVMANGGHVCWAPTGADANDYIAAVARRIGASTVVKSKSMATEESGLNEALADVGCEPVETDLGEWIIQLAGEHPSHIIAPAVHKNRHQVADTFEAEAQMTDRVTEPAALVAFARAALRDRFLAADLGITGANFGVAETGSIVLVTNEGNARMATSQPRIHIAVMGAERVTQTWEQADLLLGLLAKSGTGQPLSSYTTVISGPRAEGEADGPDEFHLVILDNGRSTLAGTEFAEMLNCIRCGACLNVCPVYRQTGGHAYGWVYSGPMGAVLTPLLAGSDHDHGHDHGDGSSNPDELSGASTLCGACMEACPVEIPLQDLLLGLRRRKAADASRAEKAMWSAWAAAWSRPAGFRATASMAARTRRLGPLVSRLPGVSNWTDGRSMPALPARTFSQRWRSGDV
ncbi:MAG: LutB/LldF family L-lactate oxidation iron-sulfur protein [Acidimicrobiales bacterium]|nr:LutB/LldF family L-lactate oxidation iron-sulfur protein [Acidimicrobiales bacterium]